MSQLHYGLILLLLLLPSFGQGLESGSLLAGMTELLVSTQQENSTHELSTCDRQLLTLHDAWQRREAWALKAVDASGSGYDDFLLGNSRWLGSRITCRAVNENVMRYYTVRQPHLHRNVAPFPFDYSLAYVRANSVWQMQLLGQEPSLLHFGLCVPQSCRQLELDYKLQQVLAQRQVYHEQLEMRPELVYTKQLELSHKFFASTPVRLLLLLLGCVLLLTLLATCGMLRGSIIDCFDVSANWQRLWQPTQEIAVINGMRVVSAISILVLHVNWYTSQSSDRSAEQAIKVASIFIYHPYLPAMLEVFFTISGFLTVSNFLRNEQLQRSIKENTIVANVLAILKQLVHRYLRLAPLQMVVVLLVIVGIAYFREMSVFHIIDPLDEMCAKDWWQNVFLIQNFYPDTMCANWTWSLASDMQTHILATLLLFLHVRHPKFVRRLFLAMLVGNVVYTILLLIILDLKFKFDTMYEQLTQWFYFNTWVRILPYLIGCIFGQAHAQGKFSLFEGIRLNKLTKFLAAVLVLWLFKRLQAEEIENPGLVAFGITLLRCFISVTTAHLILASFQLDKSLPLIRWLVNLLQLQCFQWFGRVTFAFYLLNALVIYCFSYTFGNVLPSDISVLTILSIAYTFIVLVLAIILTLFFEVPLNRLSGLLLSSKRRTNKQN